MRARLAKIRFGMNANNGCTGPIFHRADCFVMTRRAKSTSNVTRADRWVASRSKWTGPYSCGMVTIWHDGLPKEVIPEIPAERTSRFNDVIADPNADEYSAAQCRLRNGKEGSTELILTVPAIFFSMRWVVQTEWLSMLIAGVSSTLIRSRMRFMSLITISRPVTFKIKSCSLDLLKLMACQMD